MPNVNAGMHPMQNIYSNMQLQQPLLPNQVQMTQQQMPFDNQNMGPGNFYTNTNMVQPPGTMQNVSVVDFKPDIMAQQQINQLQQQYQMQGNGMGVPQVPTMGLIGPDGRYQPVTAASSSYGRQEDYNTRSFDDPNDPEPRRSVRKFDRPGQNMDSDYARSDPYPSLESMIDRSVDKRLKDSLSGREDDMKTTTGNFQKKSSEEQKKIIAEAVKEVTKRMETDREISDFSSEKKTGTSASSRYKHSYDDY